MVYCTLFYSNYLDKAKVMIDSLRAADKDMIMYILCMDHKTKELIDESEISGCITIPLTEFEDEELIGIKNDRSRGEYCWTCTAKLIKYVLEVYGHHMCTYVDADLYFYSNPKILIDEMINSGCSVQVVPHNFPLTINGRKLKKENGSNCVQFNTFCKTDESMGLLKKWIEQCIKECSVYSGGDQKYIDDWDKYDFVNISKNIGAGVAPWNVGRFKAVKMNSKISIKDRKTGKENDLVFYHYQNVVNKGRYKVIIYPMITYWVLDKKFIRFIYYDYLKKTEDAKIFFESKFNFLPIISQYISEGGFGMRDYIRRIIKSPIKTFPIVLHRINLMLLGSLRKKTATIDVRKLQNTGGK